ncbi:hypothetical protein Micbo1qcDRAFT_26930 [Microdochium bolleyi]|uniref:Uncharacterized protein n=1 Tax=Microdochium bolleyi TaxID=196109 RepID=A0A136JEE2_9PEZI|nr:hypothetical protein Micbo1qcDRAFT_26930 [Microdochium bolleyi]
MGSLGFSYLTLCGTLLVVPGQAAPWLRVFELRRRQGFKKNLLWVSYQRELRQCGRRRRRRRRHG